MASTISQIVVDRSESAPYSLVQQFSRAAAQLNELAEAVVSRRPIRRPFEQAEACLAALPLSPHDFAVARCHIRHAKRLVWHGELDAASEELKMVAACLFVDKARTAPTVG